MLYAMRLYSIRQGLVLPIAASMVLNACANIDIDQKTQNVGVGAAVGCVAGVALAKLTRNDAATACVAGAVVGGLIGYQRARSAEIDEAREAAEAARKVEGAKVSTVQTEAVSATDKQTGKTESVSAFKSVSVDIPVSQLETPEGREAMRKLNDYARKVASQREETVEMSIATAPAKGAKAVAAKTIQTSEKAGGGTVVRKQLTDARVPANVQRVNIEVKNPTKVSV